MFQNLKRTDFVARLFKQVFHIILVFRDALRTPNYSSEEVFIKSCEIQTGLHKQHFYFYRTGFAMKRGHSACTTTP